MKILGDGTCVIDVGPDSYQKSMASAMEIVYKDKNRIWPHYPKYIIDLKDAPAIHGSLTIPARSDNSILHIKNRQFIGPEACR